MIDLRTILGSIRAKVEQVLSNPTPIEQVIEAGIEKAFPVTTVVIDGIKALIEANTELNGLLAKIKTQAPDAWATVAATYAQETDALRASIAAHPGK